MINQLRLTFLLLLMGSALASPAWAITLTEAAKQAARQHNAKVVSARTVKRNGQRVHEIKLVTADGVVKTVRIPEKSG
jgi:uncharacterized membrane protein YkoI